MENDNPTKKSREGQRTHLMKVFAVQREYQKHKRHEGILDSWIWANHIEQPFYIGYRTMKNYLEINVKREWRRAGFHEAELTGD